MEMVPVSPASCASCSHSSLATGSQSSNSLSLACIEHDLEDYDLDMSGDQEPGCDGCCEEAARVGVPTLPSTSDCDATNPGLQIRADIVRQRELSMKQRRRACGGGTAPDGSAADNADGCWPPLKRRLPPQHRGLIVDWMRQVCCALALHPSTFFTATSLLDRFVAATESLPPDGLLQLLALTCMSVAVKYNESLRVAPAVWLGLAVGTEGRVLYQARDLQRCEFTVLQTIGWQLHEPTTYSFLEQFCACLPDQPRSTTTSLPRRGAGAAGTAHCAVGGVPGATDRAAAASGPADTTRDPWDGMVAGAALDLAELSLLHNTFLSFEPSTIALACVTLAQSWAESDGEAVLAAAAAAAMHGSTQQRPTPAAAPASIAVADAAGLPLHLLAPGLESCMAALMQCCWSG